MEASDLLGQSTLARQPSGAKRSDVTMLQQQRQQLRQRIRLGRAADATFQEATSAPGGQTCFHEAHQLFLSNGAKTNSGQKTNCDGTREKFI